jgi:hypothetical protein
MPTYEVRLSEPVLVSVTVEAHDEWSARIEAQAVFEEWAKSLSPTQFKVGEPR